MNINRAENGFIKLHKSIMDTDLAHDNAAFVTFIRMLLMAHHEDDFTSIRFGGKRTMLKAGELSASISELANFWSMPQSTVRKAIDRLIEGERISKRTDRQITIFTICNWNKYQGDHRGSRANERANDRTNDVANVTEGKKRLKNIKNNTIVELDAELLKVLNTTTNRNFRVLPKGYKTTLQQFTLEEIRQALTRLAKDDWHKQRLGGLSSDYLLRASTIDRFVSSDDKQTSTFADRLARMQGTA